VCLVAMESRFALAAVDVKAGRLSIASLMDRGEAVVHASRPYLDEAVQMVVALIASQDLEAEAYSC
jgi:hypothetical protein